MRLQLMSDLHLEHYKDARAVMREFHPASSVDALVLAGDIDSLKDVGRFLSIMGYFGEHWPKVFYVPGNHEFYGCRALEAQRVLMSLESWLREVNIEVLCTDKVVEWRGWRFLGDAMWFPDHPMNVCYTHLISDFNRIDNYVPWVYEEHEKFRNFLVQNLRERDIVITHYLPHPLSVHPRYRNEPTNCFFLGDMSTLIHERSPSLWVHGHTHASLDYQAGATRVVCNPLGYPRYKNPQFDGELVIEVGEKAKEIS